MPQQVIFGDLSPLNEFFLEFLLVQRADILFRHKHLEAVLANRMTTSQDRHHLGDNAADAAHPRRREWCLEGRRSHVHGRLKSAKSILKLLRHLQAWSSVLVETL